jgi:hypothetical protein
VSVANSAFKISKDFFYETGLLHKWTADEMMGVAKSTIDTPAQFLGNAWDDDPNTFRHLGENVGSIAQSAVMMGVNAAFMTHSWRRLGGIKAKAFTAEKSGITHFFTEGPDGKMFRYDPKTGTNLLRGHSSEKILNDLVKKNLGNLKGGVIAGSQWKAPFRYKNAFLKEMGFVKGIGVMMGPLAVMAAGRAALGVAGSFVDEALGEYRKGHQHYYDTRYFNTDYNTQNSFNTIGMAMRNQESRYLSVARIFHSR